MYGRIPCTLPLQRLKEANKRACNYYTGASDYTIDRTVNWHIYTLYVSQIGICVTNSNFLIWFPQRLFFQGR